MHVRTRAAAILAAACVLLAHLISVHHETAVAHVRDSVGALEHAHALADFHEVSTTPHLHGRDVDGHGEEGTCSLLAGLDQSTVLAIAPALVVAAAPAVLAIADAPAARSHALSVIAFAPKTSPPSLG